MEQKNRVFPSLLSDRVSSFVGRPKCSVVFKILTGRPGVLGIESMEMRSLSFCVYRKWSGVKKYACCGLGFFENFLAKL